MGLIFNRGCSSHHYGDKQFTGNIHSQTDPFGTFASIYAEYEKRCVHDGCDHTETETRKMGEMPARKLEKLLKYDLNRLVYKVSSKTPEEAKRKQCETLAKQIKDGEYENLEDLKEQLEEEAKK